MSKVVIDLTGEVEDPAESNQTLMPAKNRKRPHDLFSRQQDQKQASSCDACLRNETSDDFCSGCCAVPTRCIRGHLLRQQDTKDIYSCDVCTRQGLGGSRFCCKHSGCDFDVCNTCFNFSRCPLGHLLQLNDSDFGYICDACDATSLSGLRLCCKLPGCDYDICSGCMKSAKCPVGHYLQRSTSDRIFFCDVCQSQGLDGLRLCCKTSGCDYDVCPSCMSSVLRGMTSSIARVTSVDRSRAKLALCLVGHDLQRHDSDFRYNCDVCDARSLSGLRLCCKLPGCDYDICSGCMKSAKCPVGHYLQRSTSDRIFFCDVCQSQGLDGLRLCCKTSGCDYDVCSSCIATYLPAAARSFSNSSSVRSSNFAVHTRYLYESDHLAFRQLPASVG